MATKPKQSSSRQQAQPKKEPKLVEYVLPDREWDRGTELLRLFVATGWLADVRPQSIMLVADPGSGKTELLDRFRGVGGLNYESDLTVRGLYKILRSAVKGAITHLVAPEFQKFLMRKASTADNMLGTLTEALEEGVRQVSVGEKTEDFGGARIGFIGAITDETLTDKRKQLRQVGFISRVAIIRWGMSFEELNAVMTAIGNGDTTDLLQIDLRRPERPIRVDMSPVLSQQIQKYVTSKFRDHSILRVFNRFRALAMASAVLDGRKQVTAYDVARVFAFHPYWEIMEKG